MARIAASFHALDGRDSQQRELLPIHTAFPFNSPRRETIAGTKIGFSRREANESGGIFVRRVRKSLKKPFRPRPAVFGRPPSIFGTHFAITSINCGTATAVRFLHLFKFGLVVLGGQPPGAAGNRDDSLLFFCVSRNAEPKRRRTGPETQQPSIAFIRAAQNRTGNEATVHRPLKPAS